MTRVHPNKSPNDPKDYLAIVLNNGLKLLLVSDLQCDKAAVSVSVGVGSMNDPDNIPGLAHLCEHLLSVEVNDVKGQKPFGVFVAENGGMFNAFTARDQTNFHFDVDPAVFPDALKRFAKFFTKVPTLTEKDVEKEIVIIDSENMSKISKDSWRKMAVDASTSNQDHPYSKFTTGNLKTLSDIPKQKGINVIEAAQAFRAKHYVSNIMSVVVYGKDKLKTLEDLCVPLFSKVADNDDVTLPEWNNWPYGKNELEKRIDVVSIADIRDFYIVFPIDNTRPYYKTFPHGYITRLLGSKGPGSLYTFLYNKQWVENSYVNSSIPGRGFGELSIGFQLTVKGLEHTDEIVLHTFEYIKMLKAKGPQQYFWDEMKDILYLQYLHQDKEIPVDFVQRTSNLMHVYPLIDVLCVGYVVSVYEPNLISQFFEYLVPENSRVLTVCRANRQKHDNFLCDLWYNVEYNVSDYTEEQLKIWTDCDDNVKYFQLPGENKFIPTDFTLKYVRKNGSGPLSWSPTLVVDSTLCKAWHLQHDEFQVAKGVIRLEIFSPVPMVDPVSFNLNQLWILTLKNIMSEEYYQASIAGSFHEIKPTLHGVEVTVSGFSHKLLSLIEDIFSKIVNTVEEMRSIQEHMQSVKGRYTSGLKNYKNLTPQNITTYYLSLLLREKRFSNEELLSAISDTTEDYFRKYVQDFMFRASFEFMFSGNFTLKETEATVNTCLRLVRERWNTKSLLPNQCMRLREVCISSGNQHIFTNDMSLQTGHACAILIQCGILTLKDTLILEIIDQIVFEPLFTQLRHREQIGYIIRSSIRRSNCCLGLLIFVQGNKQPAFLRERIYAALINIEDRLASMSSVEFDQQKRAVKVRKEDRPKTMLAMVNKVWNTEIFPKRYDFKRIEKELHVLQEVSREEVISYFQVYFGHQSKLRRILELHLSSNESSNKDKSVQCENSTPTTPCSIVKSNFKKKLTVSNIVEWKLKMSLYPSISSE